MFRMGEIRRRLVSSIKKKFHLGKIVPVKCYHVAAEGFVPIYVGEKRKRYKIPLKYLSSPRLKQLFSPRLKQLLEQSEEEFGTKFQGPIWLRCNVKLFEEVLKHVRSADYSQELGYYESFSQCNSMGRIVFDSSPLPESLPCRKTVD